MKKIPLRPAGFVQVDDEDYDILCNHKWLLVVKDKKYISVTRSTKRNNKTVYLHKEILGASDDEEVDHADGDTLNCTRINLRRCDHQQNSFNQRRITHTKSNYKGVTKDKPGWRARIGFNYKRIHLGFYESKEKAAMAYDLAATYLFKEFARLNFPDRKEEYLNQLMEVPSDE